MNRRLMTLNAQSQQGDSSTRANALSALVKLAADRQQQLAGLIADRPDLVFRHALSAQSRASLPAAARDYVEQDITADGDLEVLHEDGPTGSRYHYFLHQGGERLSLHFAADAPVLQTGDRVRLAGLRVLAAVAVSSGNTVTVQSLAASGTFGAQKTALILVNFQDKPTQTWVTPAQAWDAVFGTGNATSVTNFYLEGSYGQAWLTGDVYGVYTIAQNSTTCNTSQISTLARQAATAQVGSSKMSTYRRFVYAFPANSCGWWGLGTVGGYPSEAWINGSFQSAVVMHEMGHNFGLYHSHALECGSTSIGTGCSNIEYGDMYDVMGNAMPPNHFNAVQKELLGWLNYGSSPPITTVQTSGVFSIDPYEPAGNNPKALKVKTPSGDWYYVEYRQGIGFDASTVAGNPNVKNGVLVHLWSQQNPNGVYLLDMTPATGSWMDPALAVGSSFVDTRAGITITPTQANGTATVSVVVGSGGGTSCVRKNPTVSVSPAVQQGSPGSSVGYTVSVTNNDTGCSASSFTTQASVPSGWSAAFVSSALTINSGASATTTMMITSPNSASVGTYTIQPTIADSVSGYSGSAQASYSVMSSGPVASFSDHFDRADSPTLGNGWSAVNGTLMVQQSEARNNASKSMHIAVQPTVAGATQSVSAVFTAASTKGGPRFVLLSRYKDAGNYYTCQWQTGSSSRLRITKVVNGLETILKSINISNPAANTAFTLGCQASGTSLTLTLNGASKAQVIDSSFTSGSVGFGMGYPKATFGSAVSHRADDFTADVQ